MTQTAPLPSKSPWRSLYDLAHRVHLAPSYSRAPRAEKNEFAYGRSYLSIRRLAGFIGLLLPTVLVLYDAISIRGTGIDIRGSVSAYYFSDARDVFVGCLFAVGVLLLTYMAGHKDSIDYWLSVVGGIGVLVVANLPTRRPGLADGALPCESDPRPSGCSFTQHIIGEDRTWVMHVVGAGAFVICSIGLTLVFALREVYFVMDLTRPDAPENTAAKRRVWGYVVLAAVTALSGLVAVAADGVKIWDVDNVWVGELGAFTAFAISWLLAGRPWPGAFRQAATPPSEMTAGRNHDDPDW